MNALTQPKLTLADYLAWENEQPERHDRSAKFALYRRIPTLAEYILVDPDTRRVEGFRRNAEGLWVLHDMSDTEALEAASIGCRITLADVFDGVDPPPAS